MKRHGGILKDTAKWKKPVWKSYAVPDFNYMTFRKRSNYGNGKNISSHQVLQKWTGEQAEQRGFVAKISVCYYIDGYICLKL